jgi:hypothetical protein
VLPYSELLRCAQCESSAPLSHIGFGTSVSLSGPVPALTPRRHWLRHLCLTSSTLPLPDEVITVRKAILCPDGGAPRI